MAEKAFFKDKDHRIAVTNRRFIVGDSMYPINQIESVSTEESQHTREVRRESAYKMMKIWGIGILVSILLSILFYFLVYSDISMSNDWVGGLVFGMILSSFFILIFAIMWHISWKRRFKDEEYTLHHIIVGVSSGQERAFSSEDNGLIRKIVQALNHAITHVDQTVNS